MKGDELSQLQLKIFGYESPKLTGIVDSLVEERYPSRPNYLTVALKFAGRVGIPPKRIYEKDGIFGEEGKKNPEVKELINRIESRIDFAYNKRLEKDIKEFEELLPLVKQDGYQGINCIRINHPLNVLKSVGGKRDVERAVETYRKLTDIELNGINLNHVYTHWNDSATPRWKVWSGEPILVYWDEKERFAYSEINEDVEKITNPEELIPRIGARSESRRAFIVWDEEYKPIEFKGLIPKDKSRLAPFWFSSVPEGLLDYESAKREEEMLNKLGFLKAKAKRVGVASGPWIEEVEYGILRREGNKTKYVPWVRIGALDKDLLERIDISSTARNFGTQLRKLHDLEKVDGELDPHSKHTKGYVSYLHVGNVDINGNIIDFEDLTDTADMSEERKIELRSEDITQFFYGDRGGGGFFRTPGLYRRYPFSEDKELAKEFVEAFASAYVGEEVTLKDIGVELSSPRWSPEWSENVVRLAYG